MVSASGTNLTANFTYNGDRQRVKSIINSETTYFAGGHYERKGNEISKYYFAGASRIAVRKYTVPQSTTLNYLSGDHLGSTSLAVNASTGDVVQTRYKPWGEVRWTSENKTLPTRYTFTGQYSYISDSATDLTASASFGLMFYNARWYDPVLGRFAQADSIVPGGVQGLDRYSYTANNPVNYVDPSGHSWTDCHGSSNYRCQIHQKKVGEAFEQWEEQAYGEQLQQLLDYINNTIVNNQGSVKAIYSSLQAMVMIIQEAAGIFGNDWDGFMSALTYVFTGVNGYGSGTLWAAHDIDDGNFRGFDFSDSGFHTDFQQFGDNQVRHFWAFFSQAVALERKGYGGPYASLAESSGVFGALIGNIWHDLIEDYRGRRDTTISDFTLSIAAINLAQQVRTDKIPTPADLAAAIETTLGESGIGSNGGNQMWEWLFITPYD